MRKISIILLALFSAITGCIDNTDINDEDARKKLYKILNVHISDSIRVTDYEANTAIGGDYFESFNVHFQKEEFGKIIRELQPQICSDDSSILCIQHREETGAHYNITSVTFYTHKLYVNYSYIEE